MKLSEISSPAPQRLKLSQIKPAEAPKSKNNLLTGALETAMSGPSGMASREPLETTAEAIDVMGGGVPRNILRYPRTFAISGAPGVQTVDTVRRLAEGGGSVSGPLGMAERVFDKRKDELPRTFQSSGLEDKILPSPRGLTGKVAGTALGMAGDAGLVMKRPRSLGAIRNKVNEGRTLSRELLAQTDEARKTAGAMQGGYIEANADQPIDVNNLQSAIEKLPKVLQDEIYSNPNITKSGGSKTVTTTDPVGMALSEKVKTDLVIDPTLKNAETIRGIIKGKVTSGHWNPKAVDIPTKNMADAGYDELGKIMTEGRPELAEAMRNYAQTRQAGKQIDPLLRTKQGFTKTKPLQKSFSKGADEANLEAIEKLAEHNPDILKTVEKIRAMASGIQKQKAIRDLLIKGSKILAGSGLAGAGIEAGRHFF